MVCVDQDSQPPETLMTCRNAPLTETDRLCLTDCIVDDGWSPRRIAERFQVSRAVARAGPRAVLEIARIGKMSLLKQAVERAEGVTVLRGTGTEIKAETRFASLHLLLRRPFGRGPRAGGCAPPAAGRPVARAAWAGSAPGRSDRPARSGRLLQPSLGAVPPAFRNAPSGVSCKLRITHWVGSARSEARLGCVPPPCAAC